MARIEQIEGISGVRRKEMRRWPEGANPGGGGGGRSAIESSFLRAIRLRRAVATLVRQVADHALHGGKACAVPLKSTMPCGGDICGQSSTDSDCLLGDWGAWQGCSGLQAYRLRSPVRAAGPSGLPCSGVLKEAGPCPELQGASRDCSFSEWGQWGACGASCGGGQRFRTREAHGSQRIEAFLRLWDGFGMFSAEVSRILGLWALISSYSVI